MKVIVGLGNFGKKYVGNRHNAGFQFIEFLAEFVRLQRKIKRMYSIIYECKYKGRNLLLVKPTTFMNLAGLSVKEVIQFYDLELRNLLIVHDDLDIELGNYKLQKGKGPVGHNGVLDIENKLKTKNFLRLRIGIENRKEISITGEEYVLSDFSEEEAIIINKVFKTAWDEVLRIFYNIEK